MAVTVTVYNKFKQNQMNGGAVDLDTDTITVSLHTSTYTPDFDTHDFFDDVTNEVSNGSGYTTGGAALSGKVVSLDTASDFAYFDADDLTWTALTKTFRYAVIRKNTGTASTSPVIALIDFGTNQSPSAIDFTLQWPAPASGAILKFA